MPSTVGSNDSAGPDPVQETWSSLWEGDGTSPPGSEGWWVREYGSTSITSAVSGGETVAVVDDQTNGDGAWMQKWVNFTPPFKLATRARYDPATPRQGPVMMAYLFTGCHVVAGSFFPDKLRISGRGYFDVPAVQGTWYNLTFDVKGYLDVDVYVEDLLVGNLEMPPRDSIVFDQPANKPVIVTLNSATAPLTRAMVDYMRTTMSPVEEGAPRICDRLPPLVSNVALDDGVQPPSNNLVVTQGTASVWLNATVDDTTRGNSSIWSANYTQGPSNWPGAPMSAVDSGFDSPLERVTSLIDLNGFAEGVHNFCVYGRDYSGNFNASGTACAQLTIGTPPEPPVMLDATLTGQGLSNVTISWQRSADDGGGFDDVVSYDVYQSDTLGSGYTLAGSVPATGSSTYSWTCVGCGEGDPGNHFFYVSAIDGLFSISAANRVAKFTGPLAPGPNLVSIPLIQSDGSIETVLQTVLYDRAWFYDSSSKEWKWCNRIKEYRRGLWVLNHTMGAWINVTLDSNLTVAGLVPAQTVIHLHEGWNLVSFPSFNSSYSVADLKLEIGPTRVEGNDPVQPYFLTVLGDADLLRTGYGYWVRVDAALDWIVHVS